MPTYPIRRRPRECKTCLPCRASKVRCDRNVPCGNCVKRNFTCSYGRPPSTKYPIPSVAPSYTSAQSSLHSPAFPNSCPAPPHEGSYAIDNASGASDDADPDLPEVIDISQDEWDEINGKMAAMEQIIGSLHGLFQKHSARRRGVDESERKSSTRSEGVYGSNAMRTGAVHLGSRSALVDILDKSKESAETALALPRKIFWQSLRWGTNL
ncbi:hypothetical protein N7470_002555 [Penicillium chermesinum]|nr:hypothetical protein N7470_002555 [Penicillium chermesinum]